jgi:hypothetical protein
MRSSGCISQHRESIFTYIKFEDIYDDGESAILNENAMITVGNTHSQIIHDNTIFTSISAHFHWEIELIKKRRKSFARNIWRDKIFILNSSLLLSHGLVYDNIQKGNNLISTIDLIRSNNNNDSIDSLSTFLTPPTINISSYDKTNKNRSISLICCHIINNDNEIINLQQELSIIGRTISSNKLKSAHLIRTMVKGNIPGITNILDSINDLYSYSNSNPNSDSVIKGCVKYGKLMSVKLPTLKNDTLPENGNDEVNSSTPLYTQDYVLQLFHRAAITSTLLQLHVICSMSVTNNSINSINSKVITSHDIALARHCISYLFDQFNSIDFINGSIIYTIPFEVAYENNAYVIYDDDTTTTNNNTSNSKIFRPIHTVCKTRNPLVLEVSSKLNTYFYCISTHCIMY